MQSDRRRFLAGACTGLCACGLGRAAAETAPAAVPAKPALASKWVGVLLPQIEQHVDEPTARKMIKAAAAAHFEQLDMDKNLAPVIGKLDRFIAEISEGWGWKIEYDKAAGVIVADENKPDCVCPMRKDNAALQSTYLCYCSEGFAERMFATVAQRPAEAVVVQSVLRGAKTCRYEITLG
jgi:hypothetical protein